MGLLDLGRLTVRWGARRVGRGIRCGTCCRRGRRCFLCGRHADHRRRRTDKPRRRGDQQPTTARIGHPIVLVSRMGWLRKGRLLLIAGLNA